MVVRNRHTRSASNASAIEVVQETIHENVSAIEDNLNNIKTATEAIESDEEHNDDGTISNSKHKKKTKRHHKKNFKDSRRFVFIIGAILGVLIAIYFGTTNKVGSDFDKLINFDTIQDYIDDWKDMFPDNIKSVLSEFETNAPKSPDFSESFAVGKALRKEEGLESKYSVVLVPGVISTGLESWNTEGTPDCPSLPHFRKRLWGSMYMLRTMFLDKACWLKHIMLDTETGLDPKGITVRAAQGFEAADFFMAGYWIWSKIIENLSAIGYEPNKMVTAAYDWRLAYLDLERRDAYFSSLKHQIELQKNKYGQKAVLIGHSMGSQVVFYFMKWVEAQGEHYGNGGPNWVNNHIAAFIDISGSMLGAPKAVPALLSGEMKDTVQLNALAVYGLEKFFSRRERLDMIRSFGGVPSMLPKGGDLIWGGLDAGAYDNTDPTVHTNRTFSNFITFDETIGTFSKRNLTVADSIDYVLETSPDWFRNRVLEHYSFGVSKTPQELEANNHKHNTWSNPLEAALPNAPDMKVFCFYGVGNPTERAYVYQEEVDKDAFKLNVSIKAFDEKPSVFFTDGDGTIPLLTHAMCHKWKTSQYYNPGNSTIKIVEIKHDPGRFDIRGGAKTAEHVDILGSTELNELVLKVASGRDDLIQERLVTNLTNWVADMDFGKLN